MELTGSIQAIFEEKQISAKFRKRELVLTTEEQYPQSILVEFTQDKIQLLDRFSAGDQVKIAINIRGREWTSPQGQVKYFVSIQGWRIDNQHAEHAEHAEHADGGGAGAPAPAPASDQPPFPSDPAPGELDDDIPF